MARKKIENQEVKVAPKTRKKSDVKKLKLLVTRDIQFELTSLN